ncbi:hypothetical protein BC937DRAFT_93317 [Endogone sp. FLAS-F59071]|nr:hypothetical protein BC937DRAFT_93317 [Endogone sp. FLAS-F59071]|eukprot:RUS23373.1 hypothetical protein BC937DRAFT_93317 [Endogone sp. FLAS-F59071]
MFSQTTLSLCIPCLFILAFLCLVHAVQLSNSTITNSTISDPPLAYLVQGAFKYLASSFSVLSLFFNWILRTAIFVLWPVFVLLRVLFSIVIMRPYNLLAGVSRYFYPVYVYCLTAACFGALVGGFSGVMSEVLTAIVTAPKRRAARATVAVNQGQRRARVVAAAADQEQGQRDQRKVRRGWANGLIRGDRGAVEEMYRLASNSRWTNATAPVRRQQKGRGKAL